MARCPAKGCSSSSRKTSKLLENPAFVIARRAKPGVAIQPFIDFIGYLDCFASHSIDVERSGLMTAAMKGACGRRE